MLVLEFGLQIFAKGISLAVIFAECASQLMVCLTDRGIDRLGDFNLELLRGYLSVQVEKIN